MIDFLNKSSFNNYKKIILIDGVENLNISSANALLKILEEPPNKTLFILITSKINLITPTIQSRCQKIFFPNFNEMEMEEYIREYDDDIDIN